MKVRFSKGFNKQYDKADKKVQQAFHRRLQLFLKNPSSPQLRLHQLTGKLKKYRSLNITGDWRALYIIKKIGKEDVAIFELLGTHSQLYK